MKSFSQSLMALVVLEPDSCSIPTPFVEVYKLQTHNSRELI